MTNPARLCAFNFGIQLVWGAVLAVSLQARSVELAHEDGVRAYATIAAIGAMIATIVQLCAGVLADRRRKSVGNRQAFYLAGMTLAVPSLVWFYLAPSWPQLLAAFFSLQFTLNIAGGPYQAAIPDYIPRERRGLASGWMGAYQSAGNAAGLIVAGFVHDLRFVALALAAPLIASWAVTFGHLRGRAGIVADPPSGVSASHALVVLLCSRGFINIGFFTLLGFLLFYVQQSLGITDANALTRLTALLFLSFTLAAIGGAALAARPVDRRDKRLVVTVACCTIALALAVLAMAPSLAFAFPAAALAGLAWGAFVTADWALAAIVLPQRAMATTMGIWNIATALPQVVAPLLTLPLVLRFNEIAAGSGPRAAIVLSLVEFLAGGTLIWRLPRV